MCLIQKCVWTGILTKLIVSNDSWNRASGVIIYNYNSKKTAAICVFLQVGLTFNHS